MRVMIWERYLAGEVLKIFSLFLLCFYGLYVLIDYSSHTGHFLTFHNGETIGYILEYYLHIFFTKMGLLFPLGLLIATVRALCQLNTNRELVALLSGGISLHRLLRPFLFLGFLLTILVYANEQFLTPLSEKKLKELEEVYKIEKRKKKKMPLVRSLLLKDQTKFLFQTYQNATQSFFDAYWIKSPSEIFRFQSLFPHEEVPRGVQVDRLRRNQEGVWEHVESFAEKTFPEIAFDREILYGTVTAETDFSLTELWHLLPRRRGSYDERESVLLATFYWKMAIPWLCLFVVILPAPFCVRFHRHLPTFLIYLGSLFGLIAFYLFLDALTVLAKRQVFAPFWAIFPLFFLVCFGGCIRYLRVGVS